MKAAKGLYTWMHNKIEFVRHGARNPNHSLTTTQIE